MIGLNSGVIITVTNRAGFGWIENARFKRLTARLIEIAQGRYEREELVTPEEES